MSEELYEQIPETMTLRQVRFQVTEPGKRTEELLVVTSLTDPHEYPAEGCWWRRVSVGTREAFGSTRWNGSRPMRSPTAPAASNLA